VISDNVTLKGIFIKLVQEKKIGYVGTQLQPKYYFQEIAKIDYNFNEDKIISTHKSWIENIMKIREELWGGDERNVNIYLVITNVWNRGGLVSLFSHIK
jgi:hypothetical protein